ncbi:MAG: hypothetical protein NTY06_02375 [Candidatus Gottesmanbacteria bacterium]|nr:hypothetical protein [Candidatus Gottesmanbacteria bacterium]
MSTNSIDSVKKWFIRWERHFSPTKRQQFVGVTILLTVGLLLTQLATGESRYLLVFLLSLATCGLSALIFRPELSGMEWLTILSLPTLFTTAVSLFYFLLPVRWLTRLPVALLYGVGMYALLLTENIYTVAADRTIALLRAAHSVGFLLTLFTYFLLAQTVLAFRFIAPLQMLLIGIVSFFLVLQSVWSMELSPVLGRRVWHISIAITVFLTQLVWVFSFLPTKTTLLALLFTTAFYSTVGMAQQYLVEKLYKKTVIEFFAVAAIVFIITLMATSWRGHG